MYYLLSKEKIKSILKKKIYVSLTLETESIFQQVIIFLVLFKEEGNYCNYNFQASISSEEHIF